MVVSKLLALEGNAPLLVFPENFLCPEEQLAFLKAQSIYFQGKSPLLTCHLWCALGKIYCFEDKLALAELCAHEAMLISELSADVYCLKGEIFHRKNNVAASIECYQLSLQMDNTNNVDALLGLASCYGDDGDDRNNLFLALQAVMQAVEIDPTNVKALAMAAELSRQLDMSAQTETYYTRALALEESEPMVSWALATGLIVASLL